MLLAHGHPSAAQSIKGQAARNQGPLVEPIAWSYVDDKQTHLVQTGLQRGRTLEFVITERDPQSADEAEIYVERHPLMDAWEARVHQLELEVRLTLLGSYQKSAGIGWTPLRVPATGRSLDLTPLDLETGGTGVEFHHYQAIEGKHAVTLIAVKEDMPKGPRSFVGRLDYSYPDVNGGNLQVLHPRLPPSVYRSVIAAQHLELRQLKFAKTPATQHGGLDPRSWTALKAVLDALLTRLVEGRLGKPGEANAAGGQRDVLATLEALAVMKKVKGAASHTRAFEADEEIGLATAAPVEGKKPAAMMEELPEDILRAMTQPKLLALHGRFLGPGDDQRLIEEGELAILRAMRAKRDEVPPHERHLVSLLEASLLLRRALAKRTRVDKEVIDRVRHAGAYL